MTINNNNVKKKTIRIITMCKILLITIKILLITITITKIYPQEIRVALCEGNTKNRGVGLSQSCGQQAQLSLMVI